MAQGRISIEDLCHSTGMDYQVLGEADTYITIPSPIDKANEKSVSFYSKTGEASQENIRSSKARVIICSNHLRLTPKDYKDKTLILVSNPRLAFIRIIQKYFQEGRQYTISPTAVIDEDAVLDPDIHIGPYTCIGKCIIGEDTIIYGNVHIYSNVKIGKNVIVHAGAVIGADGYSYERNEKGELEKYPHIGGVIIEDEVEIGSNTSIDRGTLGDTFIGRGTKIDNQCHIAHNVIIGKHCAVVAQSMIGGSTEIGDDVWIGPGALISSGIKIGNKAFVTIGAVVTKDVPDGARVTGNFAIEHEKFIRFIRSIR